LIIWLFITGNDEREDITENYKETYGMVYGSSYIHKQYSRRRYRYRFYHNGKTYKGSSTGYKSLNIQNGNFYKIEFSDQNPEHSRMIFETEYLQIIGSNKIDNEVDTLYVIKKLKLQNEMNELIESYKFITDSI